MTLICLTLQKPDIGASSNELSWMPEGFFFVEARRGELLCSKNNLARRSSQFCQFPDFIALLLFFRHFVVINCERDVESCTQD